jgi:hypothetical protein
MTRAASENGVDVVGVADLLTPALSAEGMCLSELAWFWVLGVS